MILIQGPLAGISCAPFRALIWRYSQPAYCYTEMISCKTLNEGSAALNHRYVAKDPSEGPVCFQLSGNDPQELAEATKRATDYGADLINLNCGCPVKKIRSKGAGSSLLMDPQRLFQLMRAMKQSTHLPVSIKIRVEGHGPDRFHQTLVQAIQDAGIDSLTVHGRHWTEHYETPCHYQHIQFFVEHLNIPVIGNGDVADFASLQRMLKTGCAGVMIGRAGVGQPWLIAELSAKLAGTEFLSPMLNERKQMFLDHVQGLIALMGNETVSLMQARRFAKYYARRLAWQKEFQDAVNLCETFKELEEISSRYFI
ncbi:MAG: dusC [Gammaproteobacteria bacterium]|jgi:tRNA-dihydrouridine synthase B|nr:dusC [Gammaproteobacteria bacterium]